VSNYAYLMFLNSVADRTTNDLTQYETPHCHACSLRAVSTADFGACLRMLTLGLCWKALVRADALLLNARLCCACACVLTGILFSPGSSRTIAPATWT
jgi:hypothetical protein